MPNKKEYEVKEGEVRFFEVDGQFKVTVENGIAKVIPHFLCLFIEDVPNIEGG